MTTRVLRRKSRALAAIIPLLLTTGCRVVDLQNPWIAYYDGEKYGTGVKSIGEHFNMHRGRWWNYYTRGACYLEYNHYKKARKDFAKAMEIRADETRDARTYGMHFLDYFPQRETGIAFFFEGLDIGEVTDERTRQMKEKLLDLAIARLTKSLDQEDTSRARYYLNRARRVLWQTNQKDKISPVVRTRGPVYARERTVRFEVAVTDDRSGVAEVQVRALEDGVNIKTPRILVELIQKETSETVELVISPAKDAAEVELRAVDLAGNWSDWCTLSISVDSKAPTAAVTIIGGMGPSGLIAAFVRAVDDSGLQEIQAGEAENRSVSCYGNRQYSGTVIGKPTGGELAIRVVDNAGNATVASIPLGESPLGRFPPAPLPQTLWKPLLLARAGIRDLSQRPSLGPLPGPSIHAPLSAAVPRWAGYQGMTPLTAIRAGGIGAVSRQKKPDFHFTDDVRPSRGEKTTSQDFFIVGGTLRNAEGVTLIKLGRTDIDANMIDIDPNMLRDTSIQSGDDLVFSQAIDISDVNVGKSAHIRLEAYQGHSLCAEACIAITKERNCIQDEDAVYQVVLVLEPKPTASRMASSDNWIPEDVYERVFESIDNIWMRDPEPYGWKRVKRFRAQRVSHALDNISYQEAREKSVDEIRRKLRSKKVDLILHGKIGLWVDGGEQLPEMTLEAIDVKDARKLQFRPQRGEDPNILAKTDPTELQFRPPRREDLNILAETVVPDSEWYRELDPEIWRASGDCLARSIRDKLPRVRAETPRSSYEIAKSTLEINRGRNDGLFSGMRLCFYTYRDKARRRNVFLEKISPGQIESLDPNTCLVRPRPDRRIIPSDLVVITK